MIKVFYCVTARVGASTNDVRGALTQAGPLATPGIRHEVRSIPLVQSAAPAASLAAWAFGAAFPHAAVVELWFTDPSHWQTAHAQLHAEIKDMFGKVIDTDRTTSFATREHVVVALPVDYDGQSPVKALFFPTRKPGTTVPEFQAHWKTTHAAIVPHTPHLRRYVQCHPVPAEYAGALNPPYDGVAELWWHNTADLSEALTSPAFQTEQPADAATFVDTTRLVGFCATEVHAQ